MRAPLAALACVLLPGVTFAQDPDYLLAAGEATGSLGTIIEVPITLTINADDVTAWQFDVCHDEAVSIDFDDIAFGAATAGLTYDSRAISMTDTGWSAEAILDAGTNVLASGQTAELYVAGYIALEEGTATITFCESTFFNQVSNASGNATPEIADGTIEIGPIVFLRGDADGDGQVVSVVDARYLIDWLYFGGPAPPCFAAADASNSAGEFGVNLADYSYIFASTHIDGITLDDPGMEECGPEPDGEGPECELPPDPCAGDRVPSVHPDLELSISDAVVGIGGATSLSISYTTSDEEIGGFQFGVCHDPDVVTTEAGNILYGESFDDLEGPLDPYFSIQEFDDGWTVGSVIFTRFDVMTALPSGEQIEIVLAYYEALDTPGTSPIEFCERGDPIVRMAFVSADSEWMVPAITNGSITVVEEIPFLRGDADGSGSVSGLQDALYVLRYAFAGGDEPPCLDAADVDDDGAVSGISDAVRLLRWAFAGGAAPPDPGPTECGADTQDDDLDCTEGAATCL